MDAVQSHPFLPSPLARCVWTGGAARVRPPLTETAWRTCTDPWRMLEHLRGDPARSWLAWLGFRGPRTAPRASDRKLRLFACACCRRVWDRIEYGSGRRAVEAGERFADGLLGRDELLDARALAWQAHETAWRRNRNESWPLQAAAYSAEARPEWAAWNSARAAQLAAPGDEPKRQCDLLRDLFGNPFRPPALDPAWLRWRDGTVVKLAQAVYTSRRFGDLPILADALEDAGCDDETILAHCRRPGEHALGCWVVDALLGKS